MRTDSGRSGDDGLRKNLSGIAALALLFARGILLWLVIPLGSAVWVLVISWGRRVTLGEFLGWLDLNLVAALQRSLLVLLIQRPTVEFQPLRNMAGTVHRVRMNALL
jgi:hypothetical protein